MVSRSTARRSRSARSARWALRWEYLREYAAGALWVLPTLAAVVAMLAGLAMSQIEVKPGTLLDRLAFQGTADDARTILISVSSTVVTVIALVLGLSVVALQLSSTQFSPRLLRNFLRDRATQVVLSVFIATFVYSAAGLFTVGLQAGTRTEEFPRLAISGAIVLLFVSLGMVVYFADHLMHSIQIDAINRGSSATPATHHRQEGSATVEELPPRAPEWAVPLVGRKSGYIQTVHPELLLPLASRGRRHHRSAATGWASTSSPGTVIGWVWAPSPDRSAPGRPSCSRQAVHPDIRVGFERTIEQDIGVRHPAADRHRLQGAVAGDQRPLHRRAGHRAPRRRLLRARDAAARRGRPDRPDGRGRVVVPGNTFRDYCSSSAG